MYIIMQTIISTNIKVKTHLCRAQRVNESLLITMYLITLTMFIIMSVHFFYANKTNQIINHSNILELINYGQMP